MKKLKKIPLLFIMTLSAMMNSLFAASPNYAMCGAKPGLIERLVSDAEKLRIKCIEDAYKESQQATKIEVAQLYELSKKLDAELKKSAIRVVSSNVQCAPRPGERARDPKKVARCQELLKAQNVTTGRINDLMGWSKKPMPKLTDSNASIAVGPPCPSRQKLKDMQVARAFNRKLFVTYERCVTLNPENMFD